MAARRDRAEKTLQPGLAKAECSGARTARVATRSAWLLLCVALAGSACTTPASPRSDTVRPTPLLALTPCSVPKSTIEVRCGTFTVFEDRVARSRRTIALKVLVLPAWTEPPAPTARVRRSASGRPDPHLSAGPRDDRGPAALHDADRHGRPRRRAQRPGL